MQFAQGSFFSIVMNGGAISLAVLALLLLMSAISWGVIFGKWFHLFFSVRSAHKFVENIDLHGELPEIMFQAEAFANTYLAKELDSAYAAFGKIKSGDVQRRADRIERTIEKSIMEQSIEMEKGLGFLASVSSSAPFIGLFGTVIGIIDAFYSIGSQGSSNIAVVAPGISVALVATAFGLFTAIPALMAYNYFRDRTRVIGNEMRSFGIALLDWLTEDIHAETA